MKATIILPGVVTIAGATTAYGLRATGLLNYAKLAINLLQDGQPTDVHSAFLRMPDLANPTEHSICPSGMGKGRCAPYLVDAEGSEYDANLAAFDALPDSEKEVVSIWFDLDKLGTKPDGVSINYICLTLMEKGCLVHPERRNLEQFQAAVGAGLRSIEDEELHKEELRRLFDFYDIDGTQLLNVHDYMIHAEQLINHDHSREAFILGYREILKNIVDGLTTEGMTFEEFALYWFNADVSTMPTEESVTIVES